MASRADGEGEAGMGMGMVEVEIKEEVVIGNEGVMSDVKDGVVDTMVNQMGDTDCVARVVEPSDELCNDMLEQNLVGEAVVRAGDADSAEQCVLKPVTSAEEDDKSAVYETTMLTVENAVAMLTRENVATKVPVTDNKKPVVEPMETEEAEMKIEPVEHSDDVNMSTENPGTCNEFTPIDSYDTQENEANIPVETVVGYKIQEQFSAHHQAPQEQTLYHQPPQEQSPSHHQPPQRHSLPHHQPPQRHSLSHHQAPQRHSLSHHQAHREQSLSHHRAVQEQSIPHHQAPQEQSSHHQSPQEQSSHHQAPQEQSLYHQAPKEHSPSHHQAPSEQSTIHQPPLCQSSSHHKPLGQPPSHHKGPQGQPPHKANQKKAVSHHQDLSHRLSPRSEMEARKLTLEMAPLLPPTSVIVSTQMLSMNSTTMSVPSSTPVSLLPGSITSMPSSIGRMSAPSSTASYPNIPTISIPEHGPVTSHHSSLSQLAYSSSQLIIPQPSLSQSSQIHLVTPSHAEVVKMLQPTSPTIPKAPKTDLLLQTAMKVLQLPDEDVVHVPQKSIHTPVSTLNMLPASETVISSNESVLPEQTIITNGGMEQGIGVEEEVQQMEVMEVGDENTYILEPVNSDEFYDDPNIMWIQETVEVEQESYDSLPNMVIILNPNGTVNEELMLANGMNAQDVEAVKEAVLESMPMVTMAPATTSPPQQQFHYISSPPPQQIHQQHQHNLPISITSLQEPIPKKFLVGIQPIMPPRTIVQSSMPLSENSRSVILDAKDDFLVLDDIARDPMIEPIDSALPVLKQGHPTRPVPDLKRIQQNYSHLVSGGGQANRTFQMGGSVLQGNAMPLPITELGTLDLSLPKKDVQTFKPDPAVLEQYVDPSALVSENTVLRALAAKAEAGFQANKTEYASKSLPPKVAKVNTKVRRQKPKDENANSPYIARKTNSLGALGNALHGSPGLKDARENAVQICPICKFQATTKNPYRHLQDHLARCHFKDRIAADLPTRKPYICPMPGCDQKSYPDWQAVMRHYIGKKHGILDKFVKEELGNIRRDDPRYKLHLRAGDLGILPRSDMSMPRPPDHHPQVIRSSATELVQQQRVATKPVVGQQQVVEIHI